MIVKVGSAVTRVVAGDSVLLSFSYCGECSSCHVSPGFSNPSYSDARNQTDHPAACEKFGEVNFGRVRNANVGNKPGAKGPDGKDIVRVITMT